MSQDFKWVAKVGCEGGPLLIAPLDDYAYWTGSKPIGGAQPVVVHYWGQFTSKLPPEFQIDGPAGHQYYRAETHDAAMDFVERLTAAVKQTWPDAKVVDEPDGMRITYVLPDWHQMWLKLDRLSAYDLACAKLEGCEGIVHSFEGGGRGIVWNLGGAGLIDVGVARGGAEILLVKTQTVEDEGRAQARQAAMEGRRREISVGEIVVPRVLVAAWAPVSSADLRPDRAALRRLKPHTGTTLSDPEGDEAIGVALRVQRAQYLAGTGAAQGEGWASHWCRLSV